MSKPNLLLLHGALGAKDQFAPLVPLLGERYNLHLLEFEGHGSASPKDRPFRIEYFAENLRDYMEEYAIEGANIFGYSMGGYVACVLAGTHPHLARGIATLGTKFHWDPETARREVGYLDIEKMKAKVPQFAQTLEGRHIAAGWEAVVSRTSEMLLWLGEHGGLTPESVSGLQQRVRIIVGDRDGTVGLAECHEMYRAMPNGELEVLPGTPHQFEKVRHERLAGSLVEFFG